MKYTIRDRVLTDLRDFYKLNSAPYSGLVEVREISIEMEDNSYNTISPAPLYVLKFQEHGFNFGYGFNEPLFLVIHTHEIEDPDLEYEVIENLHRHAKNDIEAFKIAWSMLYEIIDCHS